MCLCRTIGAHGAVLGSQRTDQSTPPSARHCSTHRHQHATVHHVTIRTPPSARHQAQLVMFGFLHESKVTVCGVSVDASVKLLSMLSQTRGVARLTPRLRWGQKLTVRGIFVLLALAVLPAVTEPLIGLRSTPFRSAVTCRPLASLTDAQKGFECVSTSR